MSLYLAIKDKFPDILDSEFEIQDDGNGEYIKSWKYRERKPKGIKTLIKNGKILATKLAYKENRASEYPDVKEQLDMLYWDTVAGTTNWLDKITEIKLKYPKELNQEKIKIRVRS